MTEAAMPREEVLAVLRRAGFPQFATDAERDLSDPVSAKDLERFAERHGLSRDWLISRMGGSP